MTESERLRPCSPPASTSGSAAVKVAVVETDERRRRAAARRPRASASAGATRMAVAEALFDRPAARGRPRARATLGYVATTGEGETDPVPHRPLLRHDDARARRAVPRARGARAVIDIGALHTRAVRHGRARQGARLPDDQPVRVRLRAVPREHRALPRRHAGGDRRRSRCRPTSPRPARRSAPCWPRPTSSTWCRAASRCRTS